MIAGDRVAVTVTVDVEPAVAFDVFTREIDRWWRRGPRYRASGRGKASPGVLVLEPRVGGRLFEHYDGGDGPRAHEAGTVVTWDPPTHLAFEWRASNFAAGETTLVDVRFVATAAGHTEVRLVHSGFAALRPDHPVRHGAPVAAFIRDLGLWWGELLTALREHAGADR